MRNWPRVKPKIRTLARELTKPIQGNGQAEVVRALFGLLPWTGVATLDGGALPHRSPARAIKAGIVYVPAERHREGLFLPHSIRENISLPHLSACASLGIVPAAREREVAKDAIAGYAIKTPSPSKAFAISRAAISGRS
jgi:ribose transport system ATP-binding protein